MWKLIGLLSVLGSSASASIHLCSEWSDAGLRHKGDVIVSVEGESLTWKSANHEVTARLVTASLGVTTFTDDDYIYFAFGVFGSSVTPNKVDLVRRVGMSRNARIGEISCTE